MPKKSATKKRVKQTPDQLLSVLLKEVEWLRDARSDDAVSEEEWHRRGKMALLKSQRLPSAHAAAFNEHYLSMQQLEAAEQLEASLASYDEPTEESPSSEQADEQADEQDDSVRE